MKNFDKNLGKPLPERSYGGNCRIYDPDVPDNPFHMFWVSIVSPKSAKIPDNKFYIWQISGNCFDKPTSLFAKYSRTSVARTLLGP